MSKIHRCYMVVHDYFFLTRQGFADTKMPEYIGNYGLMYALNRNISSIQRVVAGTTPHYKEDIPQFQIYATPAKPVKANRVFNVDGSQFNWYGQGKTMQTYNSINTITNTTSYDMKDPRVGTNFPLTGRKEKDNPLECYEFYTIGHTPQRLVRIGKKMCPARIISEPLSIQKATSGIFKPTHPINPSDIYCKFHEGVLYQQFPPLVLDAKLEGSYCICKDVSNGEHIIALPAPNLYSSVNFINEH